MNKVPGSSFRLLAIGDVHMSNALPLSRPTSDGRTDRLEDQVAMWGQLGAHAAHVKADAVVIVGDLFDKKLLDAVTLTETVRAITAIPCPVFILPGNHDANSLKGGRFTVEVFAAMRRKGITLLDGSSVWNPKEWLAFWPVPYATVEETRTKLEAVRTSMADVPAAVNVLLFHNSIIGCRHLGWECDDGIPPEEVCEGFQYVISGHFHTSQTFGPDDCGMYLGAPMQHNFGDVGEVRGFWDMTFTPGGRVACELIPVEAPRFHAITSLDAVTDAMLEMNAGDYLRISITATRADWITIKPRVLTVVEQLNASGFRVRYQHVPVYHHEARIQDDGEGGKAKFSMEDAITQYVESGGVVVGGLDKEKLRQIAHQALAAARQGM